MSVSKWVCGERALLKLSQNPGEIISCFDANATLRQREPGSEKFPPKILWSEPQQEGQSKE
jgi:hypothetical protein